MPSAKLSEKWWKKNKAKTLTNTGISDALKSWEGALASEKLNKIEPALKILENKVDAAIKAANKILHKQTIKYLKEYKSSITTANGLIRNDIGKLEKQLWTKPVGQILKADSYFKTFYWDCYGFIYEMAMNGKKGNMAIYTEFVPPGSRHEINVESRLQKAIMADVANGQFDTPNWTNGLREIAKQWRTNTQVGSVLTRIELDNLLPILRKM